MGLRQKSIIGLDIGTNIKLIKMDRKGSGEKCVISYTPQGLVSNRESFQRIYWLMKLLA